MHEPTPQVAAVPAGDAPPAGFFGPPPCRLSTQATVPPAPSRTTRAATPNRTATIGRRLRSGTGGLGATGWVRPGNTPGWPENDAGPSEYCGGWPGARYGADWPDCGDHDPGCGTHGPGCGDPGPGCCGGGDHGGVG